VFSGESIDKKALSSPAEREARGEGDPGANYLFSLLKFCAVVNL